MTLHFEFSSRNVKFVTAEQQELLNRIVWVDPDRLSGVPCFKGTRVPVQALIDHIEGNSTLEQFLEGFPSVTREQAVQFIELARDPCWRAYPPDECVHARCTSCISWPFGANGDRSWLAQQSRRTVAEVCRTALRCLRHN
jgi:uncharacterized protein (DUF433 family)